MAGSSLAHSRVAAPAPLSGPVANFASVVPDDFPLISIVERNLARLQSVLLDGQTIEGVLVELYNLTRKNSELMRVSGEDLVPALCDALETGGKIGQDVYLMPFSRGARGGHDVTVALDYKFKAELVVRAGGARSIDAFPVFANEPFQYELGSSPFVRHQILPESKRGQQIGAYAVAHIGHGIVKVQWCDFEMIEKLRKRSRSWSDEQLLKKREQPGCPEWYGPKTAVHRLVKLLPKNQKLTRILGRIDREDRDEFGAEPEQVLQSGGGAKALASGEDGARPSTDPQPPAAVPAESFDLAVDLDGDDEAVTGAAEMSVVQAAAVEYQKRPLGTLRNSQLRRIEEGARAKVDEEGDGSRYVPLLAACRVLLSARERGEVVEPSSKTA